MRHNFSWYVILTITTIGICGVAVCAQEPSTVVADKAKAEENVALSVQDNMDVGMEYTLISDGIVVDSTEGKAPFHYVHGKGQIVPGLERQMMGMSVGQVKEVTVSPDDGYGQVDQSKFTEVPRTQLPKEITPAVGMALRGVNADGQSFGARISEIKKDTVMLDLNHPLAGKTLVFKVKVTDIAPAAVVQ